jgi:protein deglycase
MEKRVLCLLTDGFEEIEAVTPIDLLRRAGIHVTVASLDAKVLTGRCGIRVEADASLDAVDPDGFDLLMIPGGPGVRELRKDGRSAALAKRFDASGKCVAAICAAPLVLMDAGLLAGRRFTAYHSVRGELGGGLDERVVEDGNLITSRGAGTAMDFAFAIISRLAGDEIARRVAAEIMA